jgi:hypothetical protein
MHLCFATWLSILMLRRQRLLLHLCLAHDPSFAVEALSSKADAH